MKFSFLIFVARNRDRQTCRDDNRRHDFSCAYLSFVSFHVINVDIVRKIFLLVSWPASYRYPIDLPPGPVSGAKSEGRVVAQTQVSVSTL